VFSLWSLASRGLVVRLSGIVLGAEGLSQVGGCEGQSGPCPEKPRQQVRVARCCRGNSGPCPVKPWRHFRGFRWAPVTEMGKHSKKKGKHDRSRSRRRAAATGSGAASSSTALCLQPSPAHLLMNSMGHHLFPPMNPMLVTGPQLYQPQVLMTHPQAAQPQSQQPQQPDDSSSSSSSSESTADSCEQKRRQKYNFRMRCKITTSATFISSLPKSRRAQLLEAISSRFDAAVTADMSNEDINKLIWLLTKVKPLTKICDLRVKRYFDLVAVLKVAAERVCAQRRGADALENLSSDMSNVDKLVREHGWQDDFSKTTTPKKGRCHAEGEEASPGNTPLQSRLQQQLGGQQQQDCRDGDDSDAAEQDDLAGPPQQEPGRRPSLRTRTLVPAPPAQLVLMPPVDRDPQPAQLALTLPFHSDHPRPRTDSISNPSVDRPGATAASVTQPNPDGPPQCSFCLQALVDDQEALLCGHVYHAYCIERYCEVNRRDKMHACPMRCHESGAPRDPARGDGDHTPNPPTTVRVPVPEAGALEPEAPEPEESRAPAHASDVEQLITDALDQAEQDANPVDPGARGPQEEG
jgi:hypothetical protein